MVEWHHQLSGHEFEQAAGDSEGQVSLRCCSPLDRKELDMLKLKLQYFGHLMRRVDSLEKTLMLGGIGGRRRRGRQRTASTPSGASAQTFSWAAEGERPFSRSGFLHRCPRLKGDKSSASRLLDSDPGSLARDLSARPLSVWFPVHSPRGSRPLGLRRLHSLCAGPARTAGERRGAAHAALGVAVFLVCCPLRQNRI